jgi:hypothetical protein
MRAQLLRLAAAAATVALLAGPAGAQSYRGYTRSGGYVPGNYGMTRPTGYSPSNYGMMRTSGYTPSNYGNPGASVPINAAYNSAATPGTPVPVGALTTLPGTPLGYLSPWSVSSFPAVPAPTAGTQATYPGAVPSQVATELATPPPATAQPPTAEQVTPPTTTPAPTEGANAAPAVAAPPPPVNMGSVLSSPYTTPTVTTTANPFAAGSYNPTAARGFATVYATPEYQSSFYAPLARVYGYR